MALPTLAAFPTRKIPTVSKTPVGETMKIFAQLLFPEAAEKWLDSRHRLAHNSIHDYRKCIKALNSFFGQKRLAEITYEDVERYQQSRRDKPTRCNRELGVTLSQIMDRAGLWDEIGRFYEPLFVPRSKAGFALEPEEERHLFEVAAKNSRWLVAYLASLLARNTCMGTSEVRILQLKNVDLVDCRWIRLEGRVKNDFRIRTLECCGRTLGPPRAPGTCTGERSPPPRALPAAP